MAIQTLKRWGNSLAVRIPANSLEASFLEGQEVDVQVEDGHVAVRRTRRSGVFLASDICSSCGNRSSKRTKTSTLANRKARKSAVPKTRRVSINGKAR